MNYRTCARSTRLQQQRMSNSPCIAHYFVSEQNGLTGSITPEFSVLSTLETIKFFTNELTGPLPNLAGFSDLVEFDVEVNSFTGPAFGDDISDLVKLENYLISGNSLTGSISDAVGSLPSLKKLWMIQNSITGTIPSTIGGATSLESVLVALNRLAGKIPSSMSNLSNLKKLYANNNTLTGEFPDALLESVALEELQVQNNSMSGNLPEFDASSLEVFWIADNDFTGTLPRSLASAPVLSKSTSQREVHLITSSMLVFMPLF